MTAISAFLRRGGQILGVAAFLSSAIGAQAQITPPRTPVYPRAAPPLTDSLQQNQVGEAKEFANPSVLGQGPSKGLIFHYERTTGFGITSDSKSDDFTDQKGTVSNNDRFVVKGYIPVWNRPHLKMVVGVNYEREEFEFKNRPTGYSLYDELEEKGLKTLGTQLVVLRPINERNFVLGRVKGELNGDYTSSELQLKDYLRMSYELVYGWKKSPTFAWGIGAQLGYTFGRRSIYPAIMYNRTWSDHWGVEALFPARVLVRHNASAKSLLFAGYDVNGLSYILKLREPLPNDPTLRTVELRETELKLRGRWEREIYDFLWFGAEGGYRYNNSFDVFDRRNGRTKVIDNKLAGTPYFSVELFVVPPRRFLKK
ncbi:hypothetical protein SAMN00120144_1898 [Hymenobacter roseosalivarius DSM 11622]|uniref:DUF6268 domain-containing protein n=1 Tax=Hymenobacter roseosalivarius DSM 11622 TaxID=645990 RepID=A0A1W1VPG5_9BACT|nr:DUF6268 family outer membrane beta-barrel protein [Hymenobacter roseosalivarius]SMB95248.1 hypothetical protein SAMN00120144_1898 [Hymenobacter roseosalivarius DSM 11622]